MSDFLDTWRQCIAVNEDLRQCAYVTGHSGDHLFPHGNEDLSDEIRLKVLRDRRDKQDALLSRALSSLRSLVSQLEAVQGYSTHQQQCELREARLLLEEVGE